MIRKVVLLTAFILSVGTLLLTGVAGELIAGSQKGALLAHSTVIDPDGGWPGRDVAT